jgi:osmotically-inducible protein OsmY
MFEILARRMNMGDKVLRQLVIDELEPSVDSTNIGVAVEKGIMTMSGHVGSYSEKMAAETAVRRVRSASGIAEEIKVRYPSDKKTADDQIAERANAIIARDAQIPRNTVMVKVEKGWVTLMGSVAWHYQRLAAQSAARKLSGVVGVSNQIQVEPRVQTADVKDKILNALTRSANIEAGGIQVNVQGDKVMLEGKVKAWYERDIAVPGVRAVEDRLVVV